MNENLVVAALLRSVAGIPPGRILVAVSGGPDSVALLRALRDSGREVAAGHVNHGLRGEESDADEAFVRELATELGVPIMVRRVKIPAEDRGASLEAVARRLRYEALRVMLDDWGGDLIATGHTQDDQAETVLLNLLRGTGLSGLGGMGSGGAQPVRPFLSVQRATILQALDEWKQPYRLDSSNDDPRFTRNRLRAEIMPLLEQFNPRAVDALSRAARLLGDDASYIEAEAERAVAALQTHIDSRSITVSRAGWAALHPALSAAVARRLIRVIHGDVWDIDARHIAAIIAAVRGDQPMSTNLPHDLHLDVEQFLVTLRVGAHLKPAPLTPATLEVPGSVETDTGTLTAVLLDDVSDLDRLLTVAGPFHALCNAEAVGDRLLLRSRRPGDRIRPLGSTGSRKVQDVMVDAQVPRADRDRIPIVHSERHIVWIPGLVLDHRAAAGPSTPRILHLIWTPNRPK